jgi:hypothetical protein
MKTGSFLIFNNQLATLSQLLSEKSTLKKMKHLGNIQGEFGEHSAAVSLFTA